MKDINQVVICGRLGRDPELRHIKATGQAVAHLLIGTVRGDETEWHRVTVWGERAEWCNNILSEGNRVHVTGRLRTGVYERDGVKHCTTEIIADTVDIARFIPARGSRKGGR